MNAMVQQRLQIEYDQVQNAIDEGIIEYISVDVAIKNNARDYTTWNVVIYGKEGTIWEGGEFPGVLKFPDSYPNNPPVYTWKSYGGDFYHMNIFPGGQTCIDILNKNIGYTPARTCIEIMKGMEDFLYNPNPKSPAYGPPRDSYNRSQAEYNEATKQFVKKFMLEKEKAEKK